MFGVGPTELLVVLLVVLLLFGAKRIPEIARGMGQGIHEFKKALNETKDTIIHSIENENPDNNRIKKNHNA
jgi:sec-independent protein translocase protein TatA